jgi:hypothetical protein
MFFAERGNTSIMDSGTSIASTNVLALCKSEISTRVPFFIALREPLVAIRRESQRQLRLQFMASLRCWTPPASDLNRKLPLLHEKLSGN